MVSLLKHTNNTDVAIEIVKKYYVKEKNIWKLKVRWWNIGVCHEPWDMNLPLQKFEWTTEKLLEFKPYKWEGKQNEEESKEENS